MVSRSRYMILYFSKLKYWYRHFEKKHVFRIPDFIFLNIRKYLFGTFVLLKVISEDISARKHFFRAIDFSRDSELILERKLISELSRYDLYLNPSLEFNPFCAKIILTTRCNYSCSFCYQGKENDYLMDIDDVSRYIRIMKKNNIRHLSLMGGEVFLYERLLYDTISLAIKDGIEVYAITTNGFSFRDKNYAEKILSDLKHIGFNGYINISISKEHQRFGNPAHLKGISAISRKVFGHNIFRFCLQENSYEKFLEEKRRLSRIIGDEYVFDFMGIICPGYSIAEKNHELLWSRCTSLGMTFFKDRNKDRYSFCMGVGCEKRRYDLKLGNDLKILRNGKNTRLSTNDMFLEVIHTTSLQDVRYFLEDDERYHKNQFPCSMCEMISDDSKAIKSLHDEFCRRDQVNKKLGMQKNRKNNNRKNNNRKNNNRKNNNRKNNNRI